MPDEHGGGAVGTGGSGDADNGGSPAQRIVLRAMSQDAGLDEDLARRLADTALEYISSGVDAQDAPELARRMLAEDPGTDASAASVVAAAAADALAPGDD
jgi:hypothetical protein